MRRLAAFLCVTLLQWSPALAQPGPDPLRPQSSEARDLIRAAVACSPTVAALVDDLSRHDVIAVVELLRQRRLSDGEFATGCRLCLLASTPEVRLVRIRLVVPPDPRIAAGMLAHELQHALEVAREPDVRDQADMRRLFTRIGFTGVTHSHFETRQAFDAGARVLSEVQVSCLADARHRRPVKVPAVTSSTLVALK